MESNSAKAYKESHKKFGMKGLYTVTVDLVLSFMDEASTRGDQSLKDRVDGMATKARQALKVAVAGMVMEYGAQQKAKFKSKINRVLGGRIQILAKKVKRQIDGQDMHLR
ncbi:hypothetical protein PG985_002936 [Apiospora marii]|uniref:uncharacterized protein n=1 Tax=Apiospora marii TaxID=335849 RepID=UPI00312F0F56